MTNMISHFMELYNEIFNDSFNLDYIQFLLQQQDIICHFNDKMNNLLLCTIFKKKNFCFQFLPLFLKFNIRIKDIEYPMETILHIVSKEGNLDIFQLLIEHNTVLLNHKNLMNELPLDIIIRKNHVSILEYCVSKFIRFDKYLSTQLDELVTVVAARVAVKIGS
jgi:ankyrin repeat protein